MKLLTVCEGGSCRSVAMLYELRDRYGHDVLHIGTRPVGQDTKDMLCDWADLILLAHDKMRPSIPIPHRVKTYSLNMPTDDWRNPMDRKLRKLIRTQCEGHQSEQVRRLVNAK